MAVGHGVERYNQHHEIVPAVVGSGAEMFLVLGSLKLIGYDVGALFVPKLPGLELMQKYCPPWLFRRFPLVLAGLGILGTLAGPTFGDYVDRCVSRLLSDARDIYEQGKTVAQEAGGKSLTTLGNLYDSYKAYQKRVNKEVNEKAIQVEKERLEALANAPSCPFEERVCRANELDRQFHEKVKRDYDAAGGAVPYFMQQNPRAAAVIRAARDTFVSIGSNLFPSPRVNSRRITEIPMNDETFSTPSAARTSFKAATSGSGGSSSVFTSTPTSLKDYKPSYREEGAFFTSEAQKSFTHKARETFKRR